MTFDWQLAERMQCGRDEKNEVVALIDLMVKIAEKARNDGLLSIEDDVREYSYSMLQLGMQLVVDGTDPEIIEDLLTSRILSGNKKGKDLVEQLIICAGVLSIQAGDNPRIVMVKCFSFLGDDADELLEKYMSGEFESRESKSVENFKDSDGTVTECFADMRKILTLHDRAVQKVLRELDTSELAFMLDGADSDTRKKVLVNMSRRAAVLLIEEATYADTNPDGVKKHIERLFEIIAKLEEAGEIEVPQ